MSKERFLRYELGLLSINAALATREKGWPVYAPGLKMPERTPFKNLLRQILAVADESEGYRNGDVGDDAHYEFIEGIAATLSREGARFLYAGRFRIGIAQKLINLYLKYLWSAGLIAEPPHCPIDGIVRDKARLNYHWISSDDIHQYREAVLSLRNFAGAQSLAEWELENFRRRDDE